MKLIYLTASGNFPFLKKVKIGKSEDALSYDIHDIRKKHMNEKM